MNIPIVKNLATLIGMLQRKNDLYRPGNGGRDQMAALTFALETFAEIYPAEFREAERIRRGRD